MDNRALSIATVAGRRGAILLVPPLAAGLILGANQTRAGAFLPWSMSIGYWLCIACLTWLTMAVATRMVALALGPWHPPQWLAWVIGGLIGSFAARPLIYAVAKAFRPWMHAPALREMRPIEVSSGFFLYYLTNWSFVLLLWVLTSWLANRTSRDRPPVEQSVTDSAPSGLAHANEARGFLRRLPPAIGRDVLAVQAEDHYLRVYTRLGEALVLASLSEAIVTLEDLGFRGQRVHRSWWIAEGAIESCSAQGRKHTARLVNGIDVPISSTYRELVRRSGLLSAG